MPVVVASAPTPTPVRAVRACCAKAVLPKRTTVANSGTIQKVECRMAGTLVGSRGRSPATRTPRRRALRSRFQFAMSMRPPSSESKFAHGLLGDDRDLAAGEPELVDDLTGLPAHPDDDVIRRAAILVRRP